MKNNWHKILVRGISATVMTFVVLVHCATATQVKYQGIAHDSLFDLCFSGDRGMAVGANGLVLESTDGGQQWQRNTDIKTPSALLGVTCTGDKRIVVGQEGSLFINRDSNWSKIDAGTDQRLFSVVMNEAGLGFAVGSFGTIIRTKDGGKNWEALSQNWESILDDFVEPHLYDISLSDDGVVTLVGEFEMVLRSMDAGKSWRVVHKGESSLFSLHFTDDLAGYAVGQNGRVLKTRDGGNSWMVIETKSSANLLSVWSSEQGKVLITGIRTLLRSDDAANSWTRVNGGDVSAGWYNGIAAAGNPVRANGSSHREEKIYTVGHTARIIDISN